MMPKKDFWNNARVAVLGGGSFGTVLANVVAGNCRDVRLWVRDEEDARAINATRENLSYAPGMTLRPNLKAYVEIERIFEGGVQGIIWALPSSACREVARSLAPYFSGEEILLHASKGVEEGTLKRISEVLREELPCPRIGVLSGPNLATEIARGEPAATVVASAFEEVVRAGQELLTSEKFRVYPESDMIGVEWAGTLKNILAIASGALDAMNLGWNARAMLITRGLAEMVRFGCALGARESTFLGLAGVGDLLATCSSPLSRNYRVGLGLAQGKPLPQILEELGSTAEGVLTARFVRDYAVKHKIEMPITDGVYRLIEGKVSAAEVLHQLMTRPLVK